MRAPATVLVSLLVLPLLAADLDAQRRRRDRRPREEPKLEHGRFVEKTFESEAAGRELPYLVYLPDTYEKEGTEDLPLVVWLHGMFEDHRRFKYRGGAEVLDEMVGAGDFPPAVFVCAHDGTRRSFYVNSGQGRFEDAITGDLLAHLEKEYRVAGERENRAIMGISMGGMGALKIALKKPELFGTVAVHSAAVFPRDPDDLPDRFMRYADRLGLDEMFGDPIDEEIWARENPLNLAASVDPKELAGLRIYFDAGTEDRHDFDVGNQALHRLLSKRGIPHEWHHEEGGGHAWGSGFRPGSLRRSLEFVASGFAAAKGRKALEDLLPGGSDGKGGKKGDGR